MKKSNVLVWLSWLIALLALIAAGAGLFWQAGGNPFAFTSLVSASKAPSGQHARS